MQLASFEHVESTEQHEAMRHVSQVASGELSDPQLDVPPRTSGCPAAQVEPSSITHGWSPGGMPVS
jgi:hypothetical protein